MSDPQEWKRAFGLADSQASFSDNVAEQEVSASIRMQREHGRPLHMRLVLDAPPFELAMSGAYRA